jgi:hypothetical protein
VPNAASELNCESLTTLHVSDGSLDQTQAATRIGESTHTVNASVVYWRGATPTVSPRTNGREGSTAPAYEPPTKANEPPFDVNSPNPTKP